MALTQLGICKGIPFANDGMNFMTFSSQTEQWNYFLSKVPEGLWWYSNNGYQYIKEDGPNAVKVPVNREKIDDCNYIMYYNTDYEGAHWHYAFIDKIQYVSDGCSRITFTEDYWQTWQFDYRFKNCYVSREHTNDDSLFNNTVPESLTGVDEIREETKLTFDRGHDDQYGYFGFSTEAGTYRPSWALGAEVTSQYWSTLNGMPNALFISFIGYCYPEAQFPLEYNYDPALWVHDFSKKDTIVAIAAIPMKAIVDIDESNPTDPSQWQWHLYRETSKRVYTLSSNDPSQGGWTPKNRKLYCYPYSYFTLDTGSSSVVLKPELFLTGYPVIHLNATVDPFGCMSATATNYDTKITGGLNPSTTITSNSWIDAGYTINAELARFNRHIGSKIISTVSSSVVGAIGGYAKGGVGGAIVGGLVPFVGLGAESQHAGEAPSEFKGGATTDNYTDFQIGLQNIFARSRGWKLEYLKKADEYFTKYGYATNEVKTPNIKGRKYWNYVKTVEALIRGDIPNSAKDFMTNSLNGGCTFWHYDASSGGYGDNVFGDYSLNNTINNT